MTTTAEVLDAWRSSGAGMTNDVCLNTRHPLGVFATLEGDRESFLLIADEDPRIYIRLNSDALNITYRRRTGDLQWVCALTLNNPLLDVAFADLVAAIVNNSAEAGSALDSLMLVGQTIDEMGLLFRFPARSNLSPEKLRGLFAEMWLLSQFAVRAFGPNVAVDSWRGPLRALHDFDFGHSRYLEVKSRHINQVQVSISSESQLDNEAGELYLAVAAFDDLPSGLSQEGCSLADSAHELEAHPDITAATISVLRSRLAALGVDLANPIYSESRFTKPRTDFYKVDSLFPRISRSSLPPGISRVSYQVSLAAISDLETDWPGGYNGS